MSNSLKPHGPLHTRLLCPSQSPRACSNSCPPIRWYHPTISSSVIPFSSHLQSFPASGSFPMNQFFSSCGQYWSFSFSTSPSNEYSGLISFRTDWLDLLAVQGTLKSLLQHHSLKASILWCSTPSLNHQHRVFSSWPIRTRLHAQLQLEGTLWGQMPASPSSSDSWKETGTWRKARTCVWRQPYDGSAWSVQSWVAKPVSLGDGLLETSGPTMKCKDTKLLIYRMREFHTLGFQSLENLRVVQSTAVIF